MKNKEMYLQVRITYLGGLALARKEINKGCLELVERGRASGTCNCDVIERLVVESFVTCPNFFRSLSSLLSCSQKSHERAWFHTRAVTSNFRSSQTHRLVTIQVRSRFQTLA